MSSLNQPLINIKSSFIELLKNSGYPQTNDGQTFQLQVETECFGIASATARFESSVEALLGGLHEIKMYCKVENMTMQTERVNKCVREFNELNARIKNDMLEVSAEIESSLLDLESHYYNSPYH